MEPTIIHEARGKTALFLLICLGFVGLGALIPDARHDWRGVLGLILFGLGSLAFAWKLIRPGTLTLDAQGFSVTNLFGRERRTSWRDISPFFLMRLPRGGKMIAYNYLPRHEPKSVLLKVSRTIGADAGLAGVWPGSKAKMVERLNAYRADVLGERA